MLTVPFITLMTQRLYEEYVLWLQHRGCDEEHAGNALAYAFIREVETGEYDVPCDVKTDGHRCIWKSVVACLKPPSQLPSHCSKPIPEPIKKRPRDYLNQFGRNLGR